MYALTEEHEAIRAAVRDLAEREIAPYAAEVDADSRYPGSSQNLAQTSLSSDNVFGDDSGALQLATVTGDAGSGYSASLVVGVDTTTTPSAGSAPSGGEGA